MYKSECLICDLDGTIADCSHRLPLISGDIKQWQEFHRECVNDRPVFPIIDLIACWKNRAGICTPRSVAFITARPFRECQALTWKWLFTHVGSRHPSLALPWLLMRKEGDRRSDVEVKREYAEVLQEEHDVVLAIEDRPSCAKMYRDLGILCLQVSGVDYDDGSGL